VNSRYPDFKHKTTQQALWLDGILTPPWVEAKLAVMAPRSIQPSVFQWNVRLARYVKSGQYEKTVDLFKQMKREGMVPDDVTFVHVLKACSSSQALKEGQHVHQEIVRRGCESNIAVGSRLIDMYAKCGRIEDAQIVFDRMPTRDVVSWTALILGYVKSGQGQKALQLLQQMQHEGVLPDRVTFVGLLNVCASVAALDEGRHVHKLIIQRGWESDAFVGSSLVDMYGKCGSIKDAERVFNSMSTRDVVCWTSMILGHVKCGQAREALELFQQMQHEEVKPDQVTFVGVLNACASLMALEEGRRVHKQIVENGFDSDVFVGTSLVDMYSKCGSIDDAQLVFHRMSTRNVVSWTAMILGLVKCGKGQKALELSQQMEQERVQPNQITFVGLLNACASVSALEEGRRVHKQIIERGCESNIFVGNSLVDMYAKCGSIEDAQRVFDRMTTRNVVSWTAMILGHVKCGQGQKALKLLQKMQQEGVHPHPVTFVGLLNACASVSALEEGRHVHEQVIKSGCGSDVFVCNSLIDMYAKCGSIEDAERVFNNMGSRDVVSWTVMILGRVKCGQGHKALELFKQMQCEGVQPDRVTFVALLNACASILALKEGRHIHEQIIQNGFESDLFVSSGLVDMYAKCGSIEDAQRVFNGMTKRDVVSWNAMIFGHVKCGQGLEALELFQQMQHEEGVQPDPVTFVAVLNACAGVAALEEGRRVHKQIIESSCESDAFVGSSLIDMYAKCGSIKDAEKVFNNVALGRNVVSWTAMLGGYAMHGHGKEALEHFERMRKEGVEINGVTFLSLLSACSHAGLVDEGLDYFKAMGPVYGVSATAEHYACMVNLLGHAGRLQEAEDLIKSSQHCMEDATAWTALLGACRVHGNCEMGERIAKRVVELDPGNSSGYMLL